MNLKKLVNSGSTAADDAQRKLDEGVPLAVTFDEIIHGGNETAIRGHLLVNAFGTEAGTRVAIKQSVAVRGGRTLQEAVKGSTKVPPLTKGDVIVFESSYAEDGVARVGQVAVRTHDAMSGPVQVLTAMARPSQSKVSKRGAWQTLLVADGENAVMARSYSDVEAAFAKVAQKAWPGGAPGFIIRSEHGTGEFIAEPDAGIDYLIEELRHEQMFADHGDSVELIPVWRLPMGRSQVVRDVDPRKETPLTSGPFTRKFEKGFNTNMRGFLPCLIVACDEEEWAFGAKTGKSVRVAAGVNPILLRNPVPSSRLPTPFRNQGSKPNGILCLYSDQELKVMAEARARRAGCSSFEKPAAPQAPRPPFGRR